MPKALPATKHYQLASELRRQISRMNRGATIPTVSQLKQQFSVSQATVERALDRLKREGLVTRPAGEMRLVVAEAADPAMHRVAMIRPDYPSPTFEALARSVIHAGRRRNWAFDLITYRKMDGLELRRAIGANDAAVLLPTSEVFPPKLMAALRKPRCPVIVIQDPPPGLSVSSVRINDGQIGRLAVEHLVALEHREILLVLSEPLVPSGDERAKGWREAMLAAGHRPDHLDELVVNCEMIPFEPSIKASYLYFSAWLDRDHPKFTAVFCAAWTGAMAVMRALREHGLNVPGDISLVAHGGEDDIASYLTPPLTAIETDIGAYGEAVVEQLDRELNAPTKTKPRNIDIPSSLVVRSSTSALVPTLMHD